MDNIADIKRRLASVKQTRQITGAMETVSVAKMRRAIEVCENNNKYFGAISNAVSKIAPGSSEGELDYFKRYDGVPIVIVVSADRGLCGAFNHDLFKLADSVITERTEVLPIGGTACERYTDFSFGVPSSAHFGYDDAQKVIEYAMGKFGKGVNAISIVYSAFVNKAVSQPQAVTLLPFESDGKSGETYSFEPSAEEVLKRAVPLYLSSAVYNAVCNSIASEHCARRAAMSASTRNADTMIRELTLKQNSARQSLITEQITEIIGSTQALNKENG